MLCTILRQNKIFMIVIVCALLTYNSKINIFTKMLIFLDFLQLMIDITTETSYDNYYF